MCYETTGVKKMRSGWGVKRWNWSISLLSKLAIQRRRLSTSSRFKLTTINGIFLLSHSIRSLFSWLLLDCPSEAFSIGLLNNANQPPPPPPLPYMDLYPPSSPASPSPPLLSLHQFLQRALFTGDGEQWPTSSCGMSITLLAAYPHPQ